MRAVALVLAIMCTSGCAAVQAVQQLRADVDDQKCRAYGFQAATDGYATCRMLLAQARANAEQAAASAASLGPLNTSTVPGVAGLANCPVGSHPWRDQWGNATCQSFATGAAVTTEANTATGCPNGSFQWVDGYGNRVCRSFGNGPTYYDTSQGCPIGTHPWRDNWGNPTCQAF
jgi:hypothetical protein